MLPIEWIVLDREGNNALLISKYALDSRPFNTKLKNVTWESCTLRKWLNGEFADRAFSVIERDRIVAGTVKADKNPKSDTNPGKDTCDGIFLLSIPESARYFASDNARWCKGTEYCYARGAFKANNGNCRWWLRSPGGERDIAASVGENGNISQSGYYVFREGIAVRPAIWIKQ